MFLRHKYSKREEDLIIREATVTLREIGVTIMACIVDAEMNKLQAKPQVAIMKVNIPEKQQQKPFEQEKPQKPIAATEREVERDPHHIVLSSPIPTAEDRKKTGSEITKLEWYMQSNYILRYNEVTRQTEYKHRGSNEPYRKVTDRVIYAMCTEARKSGINVWDNDIKRHTFSSHIEAFHPMKGYLESLPKWDGKDRVTPLAERVSKSEFWVKHFHTWMCGLTAQWLGKDELHGNSVAPILISKRQGR